MSVVSDIRDEYADAVGSLGFDLDAVVMDLSAIRGKDFMRLNRGSGAGDVSAGEVVTGFESALDRQEQRLDGLWDSFNVMSIEWDSMMWTLRHRLGLLEDLCASEDPAHPYTLMDIPF